MIHDPRVDVGGNDLQVIGARQPERQQRVDERPRLVALRRTVVDQGGTRRQIEPRADHEHAPDAP